MQDAAFRGDIELTAAALRPVVIFCLGLISACATSSAAEVRALGMRGETEALLELWAEADRDSTRASILEALAEHPEPRGQALATQAAVHGGSAELRGAAVRALGKYDGEAVTTALITALGDPFPAVRQYARSTLAQRGDRAIEALLSAAASAPSPLVRSASARLLADAARSRLSWRNEVQAVLQNLARRDDAPEVRSAAVRGLGRLGAEEARSLLQELMRTDDDPDVRMSAERALAKLGPAPGEKSVVVAVLPLRNASPKDKELDRLATQIAEYVAARLSAARVCQVVDWEKMDQAISEMKKHGIPLYDGDSPSAPEIGRFKLANQLVYGSLQREGLVYTIVLNRLEVSTLQLVPGAAATVSGYRADLDRLKVEVTERFLANFR